MIARSSLLVLFGAAVQALALVAFCWLAKLFPESPLKLIGFGILGVGSWLVLRRLFLLPSSAVLLSLVALSCAAPVVLSLASMSFLGLAKDMVFLSVENAERLSRIAGLVFICYAVAWAAWHVAHRSTAAKHEKSTGGNPVVD